MADIAKKMAKLMDVKSIVTLILTIVFCILAVRGDVSADQYLTVFTVVISFYFGTQFEKKKKEDNYDKADQS